MKGIELHNFVKDCLLFGKREAFFVRLGVLTWLCITIFFGVLIITSVLIYQYIQLYEKITFCC